MLLGDINFNDGCPDPFQTHHARVTLFVAAKTAIGCLLLVVPRVFLLLFAVLSHYAVVLVVSNGGRSSWERVAACRIRSRLLYVSTRFSARLALCGLGFWRLPETRPAAAAACKPPLPNVLVSNHVSYVDILYFLSQCGPVSFVAKAGVRAVPIIGLCAATYGCIFVDRAWARGSLRSSSSTSSINSESSSSDSAAVRSAVVENIVERVSSVSSARQPRILIFPEGTTTNNRFVLKFLSGAFVPMKPVQPIALQYRFQYFDPSYLRSTGLHILCLMSQFSNSLCAHWLLPIDPSKANAESPREFAALASQSISQALAVPVSEATLQQKKSFMEERYAPSIRSGGLFGPAPPHRQDHRKAE